MLGVVTGFMEPSNKHLQASIKLYSPESDRIYFFSSYIRLRHEIVVIY